MSEFVRQPTTIIGLATCIATIVALATGAIDLKTASAGLGGALTMILIPDNTSQR